MKKLLLVSVGSLVAVSVGMMGCSSDSSDGSGGTGGQGGTQIGGAGGQGAQGGSGNTGNTSSGGTGNGGAGGTAGTGAGGSGGSVVQTELGATCQSDTDCGGGEFTCLTADNADGGIARGMCTKNCTSDAECGASGHCSSNDGTTQGLCYEACTYGEPAGATELDPNKCHGRNDLGCFPDTDANGDLDFTRSNCVPLCRNDEDCGPSYCNPASGICEATEPTGLDFNSPCSCTTDCSTDDPCKSFCLGGTNGGMGTCTELCVNGDITSPGACGSSNTGAQDGTCLLGLNFTQDGAPEATVGDALGACAQLCDCEGECRSGNCWSLDELFQQAGACQQLYGRDGVCFDFDPMGSSILSACSGTGGTGGTGGGAGTGGTGGTTGGTGGTTGGTGGTAN
ncbi:MAG: hypothetical protein R3B07_24680 [Polyangiaceae bacterium]